MTGEKADAYLNGVTAQDLSLIQRHIAGIEYLNSDYKHVAADADGNTSIDIRDVLDLRKLLLGINDELPSNKSWRTIDSDYGFPGITHAQLPADVYSQEMISHLNMNSSDLEADFIGVKVGDVDGDAIPNAFVAGETRGGSSLQLESEDVSFTEGQLVTLAVRSSNFEAMTAYQFTFGFDNNVLEYTDVTAGALGLTSNNFGTQYADRGLVTTVWYAAEAESVSSDEVLFTMTFRAKQAGSLSSSINIGSAITEAMAFSNDVSQGVAMKFTTQQGETVGDAFALFQNTPNPFKGETQIGYIILKTEQ